ncbi:MAG: hypothetical protein AAB510_01280 [Patescibacteria group bacterium]
MPPNGRDKINKIEELKTKLFSKSYQVKVGHFDKFKHVEEVDVPDSWEDSGKIPLSTLGYKERFFMKTSIFKNFFTFSIVFFVLTLGYASYVYFISGNSVSNNNIDMTILGNSFTSGGEELSLVVGITNRNTSSLELVDLIIEYPKGGEKEIASGNERLRQTLGTIPAGSTHNENIKLVLFGEQGSIRPVKFSIEYRVTGSNSIFVKEKSFDVSINSTPINLLIEAPDVISPNQDFVLKIKSSLNATKSSPNVLLKVEYPVGFVFSSAEPKPSIGNNVWDMGDLAPGATEEITVHGKMLDVFDGEEKSFRISSGSESVTDKSLIGVIFNSLVHTVLIKRPFIEANLLVNGEYKREYAVDSKNVIRGEITWRNNLDTKINDVVVVVKVSGNAFNKKTVDAEEGLYDSVASTITWNKFSQNDFAEVNPGDSGSLQFSISPISLISAADGLISDPSIKIEVSISGRQVLDGYSPKDLNNSESKVVKIISDVGLGAKALYYSGVFKNTGPVPPKVEKETTYTIVWSLSNTANDISRAQVKATLPQWVRFLNNISPSGDEVIYNSQTREITWNVGRIQKGTTITQAPRSVSFQIGFTPLYSQVSTVPVIINSAILTGHDDFANVDVRVNKASLRTDLSNDSSFPASGGVVSE